MEDTAPKNIDEAIAAIYHEVGYVQKKRGGTLNYAYAGETALIEALRPAMVEHGITIRCISAEGFSRERFAVTKNGYENNHYFVTAVFTFRFTHATSQTHVDAAAIGEGFDSLDKASYKAMTGALKYALRQTFLIETGDDPDKYQGNGIDDRTEEQKRADERAEKERGVDEFIAKIAGIDTLVSLDETEAKAENKMQALADMYPDLKERVDAAFNSRRLALGGSTQSTPLQ